MIGFASRAGSDRSAVGSVGSIEVCIGAVIAVRRQELVG